MRFEKVFSNLEPEGRGRGIIMGVTGLLLLGPFYTIQIQTHQTFLGGSVSRRTRLTTTNIVTSKH